MATFLLILQILGALNGIWALIERLRKKINAIEDKEERKLALKELRGIYREYRHRSKNKSGKLMEDLDTIYSSRLVNLEEKINSQLKEQYHV